MPFVDKLLYKNLKTGMIRLDMSKKYFKTIIVITTTFLVVILSSFFSKGLFRLFSATYTDITTQVTVGNSAPSFTSGPAENTASTNTAPTSIGGTVQFNATATDANGESYYLIVCSTNSVTAGSGGSYPSCGGTLYCRNTTAVSSGSSTSCSYTTVAGDAWSNAWYAFVCDNNSTAATCSSDSQGSGDSGSPFFVNHPPVFTVIGSNTPQNPGSNLTWTTTASDPDTGSTVELLVCKTNAMSSGACTGGNWCTSTAVASNPTCSYSIPTPTADGSYDTWVFVVDQFDLGAAGTGTKQASESDFVVSNVAPSVASVTLNGGSAISLNDGTTQSVSMTASVTDNNGCRNLGNTADEISNVKGYLYRSGVTYATCDTAGEANNNNCYPEVSCSAGTCTNGVTTYTCSATLQYYADPTDTGSKFPTENWLNSIKATDDNAATGTTQVSSGVELTQLVGGDTTPTTLDYGTLLVGGVITPLSGQLTTSTKGNTGLNANVKAMSATLCTNYPTCTGGTPITIGYQRYSLTSSTAYTSGTTLTTSDVLMSLLIPKQTTASPNTKITYWGIQIPSGTLPGVYTGLIRFTYAASPSANW